MLSTITISTDKSCYRPGDSISGSVLLNLHEPLPLLNQDHILVVSVLGKEKASWNQEAEFAYIAYGDEIPYVPGGPLTGELVILDEKITVKDYDCSQKFCEGKHEFSFSHQLPFKLPASTHWRECSSEGSVAYEIRACLKPFMKETSKGKAKGLERFESRRREVQELEDELCIQGVKALQVLSKSATSSPSKSHSKEMEEEDEERNQTKAGTGAGLFCLFLSGGDCGRIKIRGQTCQSVVRGEEVSLFVDLMGECEEDSRKFRFELLQKTILRDDMGLKVEYEKILRNFRLSDLNSVASVEKIDGGRRLEIRLKSSEDWALSSKGSLVVHEYKAVVQEDCEWYRFWRKAERKEIELVVTGRVGSVEGEQFALEDEEDAFERCRTGDSDFAGECVEVASSLKRKHGLDNDEEEVVGAGDCCLKVVRRKAAEVELLGDGDAEEEERYCVDEEIYETGKGRIHGREVVY